MNKDRRNLMKGMLAAGVLGVSSFPAAGLATGNSEKRNLVVLLNGSSSDHIFAEGVKRSLASFRQAEPELLYLETKTIFNAVRLQAWLKQHQGLRMVGLLDEAGYVLFSTMAHDAGSRLLLEARPRNGQWSDPLGLEVGLVCTMDHDNVFGLAQALYQDKAILAGSGRFDGLVSFVIDI